MVKEKINWRSFVDEDNEIMTQWNSPGTPTFYVVDHQGKIRRKWRGNPGEQALDSALEQLIREAEQANPPK
ncbi:MAG: nitrogen regulatory protein PII-like uncharacterized protein [Pirellulaceae bacterium]|jgi:nitrogen regulatory protein PII-like uncharacterized protein